MTKIYYTGKTEFEDVISLNLVRIEFIPFYTYWNEYDYIIFTSKNGVKAANNYLIDWQKIPSLCIGEKTAQLVKEMGGIVKYQGRNTTSKDFGYDLMLLTQGKKVLIVGPEYPIYDLNSFLNENGTNSVYEEGYKSKINSSKIEIEKEKAIIIITSPKHYNAFKINYGWKEGYIAICIGPTTYNELPNDIIKYQSEDMTIESCIKKAKEILNNL
jgi:uroporphyrinogen-III synthase